MKIIKIYFILGWLRIKVYFRFMISYLLSEKKWKVVLVQYKFEEGRDQNRGWFIHAWYSRSTTTLLFVFVVLYCFCLRFPWEPPGGEKALYSDHRSRVGALGPTTMQKFIQSIVVWQKCQNLIYVSSDRSVVRTFVVLISDGDLKVLESYNNK